MSIRKVKSTPKLFVSDSEIIQNKVIKTLQKISDIVGSTLGPSGKVCLIESDYPGIPNKNTKDGVTVFRSLGANDPFEHLIIEQTRDAAVKTVSEAGDGTTTATVLAAALTENLLTFCSKETKISPQKVVRTMNRILKTELVPLIQESAIKIGVENQELLEKVAKVSANGDEEMASAVIQAFEEVGYGENSHVTIQELSGPGGYQVELIDGYPIPMGYEESIGKFHTAFINDQANLRCTLENPKFILFDGQVNDLVQFQPILESMGREYVENGKAEFRDVVIIAHGFSESVLTQLAYNFSNPSTINVVPFITPMNQVINSRLNFLIDMSAFTGAKLFGMANQLRDAQENDFGNAESFEIYRFRATVVGQPDPLNIQVRADELRKQLEEPESEFAAGDLQERLGKLTNGIARLKVFGGSTGELKERHDRAEDAVCAVRAAIGHGALPGGCRTLLNMVDHIFAIESTDLEKKIFSEVLAPSLFAPIYKLLDNAGYNDEEKQEIVEKLMKDKSLVYDIENQKFGTAEELGVFDAAKAVEEAVKNSFSIASVMGVMGGIVCYPRDHQLEIEEAKIENEFNRAANNPHQYINEADERF